MGKTSTTAKNKYNTANYDRINLVVEKGKKEKIKAHAETKGESINGFINRAIEQTIKEDTEDEYDIIIANQAYDEYIKSGKKSTPIDELFKELDT